MTKRSGKSGFGNNTLRKNYGKQAKKAKRQRVVSQIRNPSTERERVVAQIRNTSTERERVVAQIRNTSKERGRVVAQIRNPSTKRGFSSHSSVNNNILRVVGCLAALLGLYTIIFFVEKNTLIK